jgi:cytochrome c peroxidase
VLEEQALVPMLGDTPIELGMAGHEPRIHAEIGRDPSYQRLFPAAFPGVAAPITTTNIAAALSAFDIAVTAPYMHDGSIATLDEVLDHYSTGGRTPNPARSTGLKPFTLSDGERRDLIAFLQSLTDEAALRDPRWSDPWK